MNRDQVNEQLRNVTRDWLNSDSVQKRLKSTEGLYSDVFVPGISEYYAEAVGRRILLFGQEARNFYFDNDNSLERIQNWVICYAMSQIDQTRMISAGQDSQDLPREKLNKSPFWSLFRKIVQQGWHPAWSNLDKFHRFEPESRKTIPLTGDDEVIFNSPVRKDEKTLVQKEIEIVKPDVIVFLVGPNYTKSLSIALRIEKKQLAAIRPTANAEGYCVRIDESLTKLSVPVYWTYHPAYILRSKKKGMSLDDLVEHIISGAKVE